MKRLRNFLLILSPYSLVAYLQQTVNLACSFAVLRWILPEELGIWQTMLIVESWCMVVRFGIPNAVNREYPFLLGQGQHAKAATIVSTGGAYISCAALLLFFGFGLIGLVGFGGDTRWQLGFLTLAFYTGSNLIYSLIESTFRGSREFRVLAKVQLFTLCGAVISLPLVYLFGYEGLLLRFGLLAVVNALFAFYLWPLKLRFAFDKVALLRLLKTGLPLYGSNYLTQLAQTVIPMVLLNIGGARLLGLYVPVNAVISAMALLPNVASTYFGAAQNYDYGRTGNAELVVERAMQASFVACLLALPLVIVGLLVASPMIKEFVPPYAESITSIRLGLLVGLLKTFVLASSAFATLKAWRALYLNITVLWAATAGLPCLAAFFLDHLTLESIVTSLLIGQALYVIFSLWNLNRLRRKCHSE